MAANKIYVLEVWFMDWIHCVLQTVNNIYLHRNKISKRWLLNIKKNTKVFKCIVLLQGRYQNHRQDCFTTLSKRTKMMKIHFSILYNCHFSLRCFFKTQLTTTEEKNHSIFSLYQALGSSLVDQWFTTPTFHCRER